MTPNRSKLLLNRRRSTCHACSPRRSGAHVEKASHAITTSESSARATNGRRPLITTWSAIAFRCRRRSRNMSNASKRFPFMNGRLRTSLTPAWRSDSYSCRSSSSRGAGNTRSCLTRTPNLRQTAPRTEQWLTLRLVIKS